MARVKIDERSNYPFSCELAVRVSDLNYGAHLGYDSLLTLAHQARIGIFSDMGVTETDLGDGQTGIVAADVAVVYRGEAFLNDVLVFELCVVDLGLVSFRLAHRVKLAQNGKLVALLEIGFAAFDYQRRRPGRLPADFSEKLGRLVPRDGAEA